MMYLIYNNDGSFLTKILGESIQQGNNGVNQIFVAIVDEDGNSWSTSDWTCVANFTLPDDTITQLSGVATSSVTVGENTYDGYIITLTSAQTVYEGKLTMSLSLYDVDDNVLWTYQYAFTVNPTDYDADETTITVAQYNALISTLNSYLLKADAYASLSDLFVNLISFTASSTSTIADLYDSIGSSVCVVVLTGITNASSYICKITLTDDLYYFEFERIVAGVRASQDRWMGNGIDGDTLLEDIFTTYNEYYVPYLVNGNVIDYSTATFADLLNTIGDTLHIINLQNSTSYGGFYLVKCNSSTNSMVAIRWSNVSGYENDRYVVTNLTDTSTLLSDIFNRSSDYYAPFAYTSDITTALTTALADYYTSIDVDGLLENKQDTLVSGTNIKTINGESLLGSGDLSITTSGTLTIDDALDSTSTNPVQNAAITVALDEKQDVGDNVCINVTGLLTKSVATLVSTYLPSYASGSSASFIGLNGQDTVIVNLYYNTASSVNINVYRFITGTSNYVDEQSFISNYLLSAIDITSSQPIASLLSAATQTKIKTCGLINGYASIYTNPYYVYSKNGEGTYTVLLYGSTYVWCNATIWYDTTNTCWKIELRPLGSNDIILWTSPTVSSKSATTTSSFDSWNYIYQTAYGISSPTMVGTVTLTTVPIHYKHVISFSDNSWINNADTYYLTELVIINKSADEITTVSDLTAELSDSDSICNCMTIVKISDATIYSNISPVKTGEGIHNIILGSNINYDFKLSAMPTIESDTVTEW